MSERPTLIDRHTGREFVGKYDDEGRVSFLIPPGVWFVSDNLEVVVHVDGEVRSGKVYLNTHMFAPDTTVTITDWKDLNAD